MDTTRSLAYLDRLFGPGMGARHAAFLEHLGHAGLIETLHRYHALEDDEAWITVEENYLIGMCVLCSQGRYGPAAMFAKTLRHLGTPEARVLEAVRRLEMWTGGIAAAEAMGLMRRACRQYDRDGLGSMADWFPDHG